MTTNTTSTQSTHDATTGTHTSPEPGKFDKGRSFIADHLFTICLAIAAIIALLAFQANGFHGALVYDDDMTKIVIIYNIAIMAYPAFLAIKAIGSGQYSGLRIGIIVASVIYTFLVFAIVVRVLGEFGSDLWAVPFLGPIVLPATAIIAHAVAASLLTRYGPKGSDAVAEEKAKIPGINANIESAETDFNKAQTSAASYTEAEDDAKTKFEEADEISKARAADYKKAKKDFDETDTVLGQTGIKEKIKANKKLQQDTRTAIEIKEAKLKQTGASSVKTLLENEIQSLDGELSELMLEGDALTNELEASKDSVEDLPEKKAMDDALAASEAAEAITNAAKQEYDAATDDAKAPRRTMQVTGETVKKHKLQLEETNARIAEASLSQRGAWRNVAVGPIVALVVAFVFYPVWYGWVLLNFSIIPIG